MYFYVKDNHYSIQAITDINSNIIEKYSYSPYGKTIIQDTNNNVLTNSLYNNTYGYTGRKMDTESGLYFYRNRMYNPQLARFMSKDPKGYVDGMNLFSYVKNNPLRYLDPMGTTAVWSSQDNSDWNNDDYFGDDIVEQVIRNTENGGSETASWFRPEGHITVVGRDETIILGISFEPGRGLTGWMEKNLPAAHTFGTIHDGIVDDVETGFAPLDAITNVATMPPAYAAAIISETINTGVDLINNVFGTNYDLSFDHNHPKEKRIGQ